MEDGTTNPEPDMPADNESSHADSSQGQPRTEREWTLKHSTEYYRRLAESARDVIWVLDQNLHRVYVSPSVKSLLGRTPEEVLACTVADVLTPESYRKATELFQREWSLELGDRRHGQDRSIRLELEMVCADASTIWTEVNAGIIYDERECPIGLLGITRNIDQRKKAEAVLREAALWESEEKYRLLIENANEGILVTQDDLIRFANPKAGAIIGHAVESLISQPFDQFIHADDRAMMVDYHHKRLRGETLPDTHIFRSINPDGYIHWMEIRVVLIAWEGRPATLNFMTDITARKQVEEALRERQARLDSILRVAPVGLGVVVERVLVEVNDRFCEITGYARSELIGQSSRMLYRSQHEFESIATYKIREFQAQGWGHLETRWQRKDGGIIDILLNYTPIDPGDPAAEVIFTVLDITEHKRADEELKRHRDRLEEIVKERTHELLQANMRLHREIAVRKRSEERLQAGEIEHKERQKALEEMNVALKILLRQHQKDKENLEHNLVANINTSVLVYFDKLRSTGLRGDQLRLMSEIERQLKKVGTSFIRDLTSEHLGLSPSEIKVATLIKEGRSSKEIAELLNVSLNAVLFHRNNLRTKLGLKDSKVNLMTYLQHYDQD